MSKPVEVYKISKECITVKDYTRGIESYTAIFADTERGLLFDCERSFTTTRTVIPIQRLVHQRHGGYFEQYIAVEPELKELLTIQERQEIDRLKEDLQYTHKALQALRDDKSEWWSQPWYKRVWSALRGE